MRYNKSMWEVEYTDQFEEWWQTLTLTEQASLEASVRLLEQSGPLGLI